jgi:general secretion pathway protein F/type IV pilus assembly protein PilC
MPDFAYIARNPAGEKVTGTVSAATEREVVTVLNGQSLFPVEVTVQKSAAKSPLFRRISGQTIATTYGQLGALIRSGVPLLKSIAILREQSSNAGLKEILQDVYEQVEDGASLAEAMSRHPRAFSETAVSMARAGGEGGFLEDALDRVAQFTEQQEDLKARTAGALAYPIFLGVVGTIVVTGLMIFFVPNFAEMFDRLRQRGELPFATELLLWISTTLNTWGWAILLGLIAAFLYLRAQLQTEVGRRLRDRLLLRAPGFGHVLKSLAVARFCRVLGTLLKNGVPILTALEISSQATGNRVLSTAIEEASENISAGESLAGPLMSSGHFPTDVVEMIAVAEQSNTLDTVLIDIADGLEKRTARRLDLAVRLLEPVMLLILASIVLLVVIALLLPILKMSSTI